MLVTTFSHALALCFSFAGKLKLPSEGKRQYYVYFHSSWRLDGHVPCDVCLLP